MTLTLELDDEVVQRLESEARTLNVSLQELALMRLQGDAAPQIAHSGETRATLDDRQFEDIARGVVNDHREVLERLA